MEAKTQITIEVNDDLLGYLKLSALQQQVTISELIPLLLKDYYFTRNKD